MVHRWTLASFALGVLLGLLSLVDAKGTPFYGAPYGTRYNLFKAGVNPHYTPGKPMTRHKNHCAYIVQKNITCIMQDGMTTYVKAEYTTKCIWGQKCPVLMYRTFFKPTYKVGYKTVTELEWRCCPGYQGENCFDGPTSLPDAMVPPFKGGLPRPAVKGYPRGQPKGPEPKPVPGGHLEPGKPFPEPGAQPDGRPYIPTGQLPSGGPNYGPKVGVSGERLDRMETDLRRVSQGLDTLSGMVAGLEDRLRVSLRDDTNKLLTTLLSGAPPPRVTPDSSVGFGVIPDGNLDGLSGGSDGGFLGYGELVGRVTEVKDELRVKSDMLDEIHGMVMGHDGQLKRLLEAKGHPIPGGVVNQRLLEDMVDARLADVRAEILDGFEKRLLEMEGHCDDRIGQVQKQCQNEHLNGQEQMQQTLDGRETGLRKELGHLQAQIQGLTLTESCCGQVSSLSQRVLLLEEAVKGLTESQRQLQNALSDQTIHVEAILETRLEDIEGRINATAERGGFAPLGPDGQPLQPPSLPGVPTSLDGFHTLLDEKLKALEERLFVAVEELSNATAPALLEGHVVPALETEIENVRRRVEADLDGVQKQLTDLELLCTSSCAPSSGDDDDGGRKKITGTTGTGGGGGGGGGADDCEEVDKRVSGRLDSHADQLERLNVTLAGLLTRIIEAEEAGGVEGEITLLKINVNSVNRTLKGLRDSVGVIAREVGRANATWTQREERLAGQVQGITHLVGRQAAMLGAGERRLIQLKGELQGLRRRLAGELQGCRSTALGVQKEVLAVDSRVSQVEGQCGSLSELADELERIRGELESHSDQFLARVNGTLVSHSQQLAQLKDGLDECRDKTGHRGQQGDQ